MRPSTVEVDLGAVAHNVARFVDRAAPAEVCAVVKADGYGHGDVPVAVSALESGATRLAVALVEEGVRLREAGIEAPILLLSEPPAADAAEVLAWGLTPTVYRHSFLEAIASVHPGGAPVPVHLKVDTGMHRVGASPDTAVDLARRVSAGGLPVTIEGLWTHFAVAEEDGGFTEGQMARFADVAERIGGFGVDPPLIHLSNTAGVMFHPEARGTMVRVGLGLYGLHPAPGSGMDLRPALRLVSRVSATTRHPAGTRPSYGRIRPLDRESTVVTVPVGYADGVPRALSHTGGCVLIGGRRHPLAGRVTMDQLVVDVGDTDVAVGDEVVLIGRQGAEEVTVDEWAERTGTINYEIVCRLGPRLPRVHRS